jgi:tRNA (adenine22-N1)-methyltransferase
VGAITVRKWLLKEGWVLTEEEILEEDGKIYEILVADRTGEQPYTSDKDAELLMGPFLLHSQNKAFKQKWTGEARQWKAILEQMENAQGPGIDSKRQELLANIKRVEDWMQ